MQNKEHTLLLIVGRTACGKDSITDKVCERTGAKKLISYTTRPRRTNEKDTHIFITESEYEYFKSTGQIAAFTQIGDYKYFCTINQLYESNIYIIDAEGIKTLKKLNLPNLKFVTIYIHITDEERQHRALELRGDDKARFRIRDYNERKQFAELEKNVDYDYSIKNTNLAKSYAIIRWIAIIEGVLPKGDKTK